MVRQYPTNSISKTTLKEQLLRLKDKKALTDPHIIRLLQSTRHTGAVIPFSPFRKAFLRSNIFATIAEKGWPAFFVTLNPNDVSSPLVKLQNTKRFTKEQLFNLFSGMSNENTGNEEWSQFSGGANGSNPVSCADYFHSIVKLFIEVFLGFDSKTKSYAPSVFGMVTDYFGVVEEQQRKQLHIHMLIWVDGLEDYEFVHSTFEDIPYKKRLLEYLDSIISCYKSEIESPIGSPCTWQCPKLDPGNITHEYSKQLNWVQSWVQNHSCSRYHCMKKQKRCRYNFPKEPVQETVYNSNKKTIYLKRNDMYLNPCFAPVAIVARFNTDIRFIPCLDKPQISRYLAYYISNYTSKHEATNLHLVDFMNKKIADYEKFNPDILENSNDLFRGLLMKTLNKFSACNNVGSVTAASCLLNYPDHYCGNHYQIINWKGWDIWLCKELGDNYRLHSYNRLTNHTFYYRVLGFGIQNDSSNASIQENTTLV
jgi:hypothetical protein